MIKIIFRALSLSAIALGFAASPVAALTVQQVPITDNCYMALSIDGNANLRSSPEFTDNVIRETDRTTYGRLAAYIPGQPWFVLSTADEYNVLTSYWVHEVNIQTAYSYCPDIGDTGTWVLR
jgi:hypothetical protein